MPIEEYVQLAREKTIDVEYNMVELVDLAWGRKVQLGFRFEQKANGGE